MQLLFSQSQLETLARKLAALLQPGDAVLLYGEVGTGKSTFARELIRHMMDDETLEVASPTFTLLNTYETKVGELWHVDAYRLASPVEAVQLGLDDAQYNAVMVIEWPEKLGQYIPEDYLRLSLEYAATPDIRRVTLSASGSRAQQLVEKLREPLPR